MRIPGRESRRRPRALGRVDIIDLGTRLAVAISLMMAVRFSHATLPMSVGAFDMVLGNAKDAWQDFSR
jgi:hypothetical protein